VAVRDAGPADLDVAAAAVSDPTEAHGSGVADADADAADADAVPDGAADAVPDGAADAVPDGAADAQSVDRAAADAQAGPRATATAPAAAAASTDGQADAPVGAPEPAQRPRELTDPRELRAMTHPVRLALLEALNLNQALTATEAGELIGESPTTCSFHLRQLAKYGFVEEAGDAPGRRRPWRLVSQGVRFSAAAGDPEMGAASTALEGLLVQRWFDRFSQWQRTRNHFPVEWQDAAMVGEALVHLTPEELLEVAGEMLAIIDRFQARNTDPSLRPAESRPVEILSFGYPFPGADR
jgi:predicted transcriptional regulator